MIWSKITVLFFESLATLFLEVISMLLISNKISINFPNFILKNFFGGNFVKSMLPSEAFLSKYSYARRFGRLDGKRSWKIERELSEFYFQEFLCGKLRKGIKRKK